MASYSAPIPTPPSIRFGRKLLEIPSLEEVGIPLGGLVLVNNASVGGRKLEVGDFVKRGDPLLTYQFDFFQEDSPPRWPFASDSRKTHTYTIKSPIHGLIVETRNEDTVDLTGGLRYQWCERLLLPTLLVPEDEPLPDTDNFRTYDQIADTFASCLDRIVYRLHSSETLHRVSDAVGPDAYAERRTRLANRNKNQHESYTIRDMTADDTVAVSVIQWLRTKDLSMRDRLEHLARAFGESI